MAERLPPGPGRLEFVERSRNSGLINEAMVGTQRARQVLQRRLRREDAARNARRAAGDARRREARQAVDGEEEEGGGGNDGESRGAAASAAAAGSALAKGRWKKIRAAVTVATLFDKGGRAARLARGLIVTSKEAEALVAQLRRSARQADVSALVSQTPVLTAAARHGWDVGSADPRAVVCKHLLLDHFLASAQTAGVADDPGEDDGLMHGLLALQARRVRAGMPKLKAGDAAEAAAALRVPVDDVAALLERPSPRQRRASGEEARSEAASRIREAAKGAMLAARQHRRRSEDGSGEGDGEEGAEGAGGCCEGCRRAPACLDPVSDAASCLKRRVTETPWFSGVVLFAILCAGVSTAVGSYGAALSSTPSGRSALLVLGVLDDVVFWLFFTELCLKLAAEAPLFWPFFTDGWNLFDAAVVVLSFPGLLAGEASGLVRVVRLLRVLKLVRVLPGLRRLVRSLANSLSSLVYIAGLILLLLYLWAVAGAILLARNDPAHWQGVHNAALTLYVRGLLGDDWADVLETAIYGCDSPRSVYGGLGLPSRDGFPAVCTEVVTSPLSGTLLTLSWQVLGTFVCLNLLVGSIVQSVSDVDAAPPDGTGSAAVVHVLRCDELVAADLLGTSDPYVVATSGSREGEAAAREVRFKTRIKFRTLAPRWANESFVFQPLDDVGSVITLRVYDYDRIGKDDFLGEAVLDFSLLPENQPLELNLPLSGVPTGTITVRVERRLASEGLDLEQLMPEDRLCALCKQAEAVWDEVRWELSAAAESRSRLRSKALAVQAQALRRLTAMVAALVRAKRKVKRVASASKQDDSVRVDRALDGWVRAKADGPDGGMRWFKLSKDAPKPANARSDAERRERESIQKLVGDTGWFMDLAEANEEAEAAPADA